MGGRNHLSLEAEQNRDLRCIVISACMASTIAPVFIYPIVRRTSHVMLQRANHSAASPRKAKKPTTSVTVVTNVPEATAGSMS
jgi:hypothetical protein